MKVRDDVKKKGICMPVEVNFDGLVGPTHFYGGLAPGNIASMQYKHSVANPREAALEGLRKMRLLMDLGVPQGVFPPHPRPLKSVLNRLGFHEQLPEKHEMDLALACFSASGMWTANIGVITASSDAHDHQVHITPANLISNFHRSLEIIYSKFILKNMFPFAVHHPANLTSIPDEGAANVMRLTGTDLGCGLHLFVYGKSIFDKKNVARHYPSRQSKEAFETIARTHKLDPNDVFIIQQNPDVIDQGVFHHDVIGMSYKNIVIYHEKAFVRTKEVMAEVKARFAEKCGENLIAIEIHDTDILVGEAVSTYLFNSQIVESPTEGLVLIAPKECETHLQARFVIEKKILLETPINKVIYVDITQSMQNGGGPACLRWRTVLTDEELSQVNPAVLLTPSRYDALISWVNEFYVDALDIDLLLDKSFMEKNVTALAALSEIIDLKFEGD